MSTDLKRCPFCGGEGIVINTFNSVIEGRVWEVRCVECGCVKDWSDTKKEAVSSWNRRNESTEIEELRKKVNDAQYQCITCLRQPTARNSFPGEYFGHQQ